MAACPSEEEQQQPRLCPQRGPGSALRRPAKPYARPCAPPGWVGESARGAGPGPPAWLLHACQSACGFFSVSRSLRRRIPTKTNHPRVVGIKRKSVRSPNAALRSASRACISKPPPVCSQARRPSIRCGLACGIAPPSSPRFARPRAAPGVSPWPPPAASPCGSRRNPCLRGSAAARDKNPTCFLSDGSSWRGTCSCGGREEAARQPPVRCFWGSGELCAWRLGVSESKW
ncbi:uncharacterized protein LOC126050970 isoform X1 [Accipiter gentilis]|uniref:uncharacterized protein LOC126050970 isoform X1 n=1 Tax=Astur gentilis TaxID=8957 RepID=UPI00210F3FD4|nr:uncharacterized protein LOC126050970 isoform X1 [Accipiter gentilis]